MPCLLQHACAPSDHTHGRAILLAESADHVLTIRLQRDDTHEVGPTGAAAISQVADPPVPFIVTHEANVVASRHGHEPPGPTAANSSPGTEEAAATVAGGGGNSAPGLCHRRLTNASEACFATFFFPPPGHCFVSQADVAISFAISEGYFEKFPERSWATLYINEHSALRWELSASMESEPMVSL